MRAKSPPDAAAYLVASCISGWMRETKAAYWPPSFDPLPVHPPITARVFTLRGCSALFRTRDRHTHRREGEGWHATPQKAEPISRRGRLRSQCAHVNIGLRSSGTGLVSRRAPLVAAPDHSSSTSAVPILPPCLLHPQPGQQIAVRRPAFCAPSTRGLLLSGFTNRVLSNAVLDSTRSAISHLPPMPSPKQKTPVLDGDFCSWWRCADLNRGPNDYESFALTS